MLPMPASATAASVRTTTLAIGLGFALAAVVGGACHGRDEPVDGDHAGQPCMTPDDCYPDVEDPTTIVGGPVVCLDRVPEGYCTHECTTDADCCAVPGECATDLRQVCAPFESTGKMMCFIACEAEDVGDADANDYCHEYASTGFGCRSTGGGADNRKVCAAT